MIYTESNPFYRFVRNVAATRPVSWLFARALRHVDRPLFRLTKGRHTFASLVSGLPVMMLATTGAKSGGRRTLPLLGFPDGDRIVVIGSNYVQRYHPVGYHSLFAHPEAEIEVEGTTRRVVAYAAEGEERDRLWRRGLEVYPGWSGYERRAGERRIPVMVLSPVHEPANRGGR